MASAAAPTANLLQTCAALLMSPYCGMHSPNIEAVLVKIGLQSTRIGLKLIDILLRNCAASGTDPASECHTLQPGSEGGGTSEIPFLTFTLVTLSLCVCRFEQSAAVWAAEWPLLRLHHRHSLPDGNHAGQWDQRQVYDIYKWCPITLIFHMR